ncbi:hypothetical protein BP6252_04480 [Coleophoma cylindrospora]|uniref:Uncharacterized protein n=1 Tax=Coleophoma cylindrospora TaxID=1849047 RepID=A0A3D8S0K7_9HELO|nr:hypothetical protein BP6252_04480 [Coleophoma cylindrospora]
MDPLTALSLAGTIIQFVDFGNKILRGSKELYDSTSGALSVNDELEVRARELKDLTIKLRRPIHIDTTSAHHGMYSALQTLCVACRKAAEELIARLQRLKVEGQHRAWKSFRQAIKYAWNQTEIEVLSKKLHELRKSLDTHILAGLRTTIDVMAIQHSNRFDGLEKSMQTILLALLDHPKSFSRDIHDQTVAVAQLLDRCEVVIRDEHDKTRAYVVDAIQVLATTEEEFGSIVQREHAEKIHNNEERFMAMAQEKILAELSFETMQDRQEEVVEAHKHTFDWIFKPESECAQRRWDNFSEWLKYGNGTYWINGKAGSGKSTLMRHICESKETPKLLQIWARDTRLTICKFFFWNSGTMEQRSQTGLLRSLVHDILRENPDLSPLIIPSTWARAYSRVVLSQASKSCETFTLQYLLQAFRLLINRVTETCKLCLFIDGLDEYDGEAAEMADLFTSLSSINNLKICLSSRPLVAFDEAFGAGSTLQLQNLTFEDIRCYVVDKLFDNKRFKQLAIREGQRSLTLVQELVTKADGVFLWVVLVVRSILVGLSNRDDIDDLERRQRELPSDLSALFEDMLHRRIAPFYQKQAAVLFQIFRASRMVNEQIERLFEVPSPITLQALSFAHEKDPDHALNAPIQPLSELEVSILCGTMEDRLKNCCAGLLELQGASYSEPGTSPMEAARPDARVQYLHRTVKDYLEQPQVWKTVTTHTDGEEFDPYVMLLKSSIRQLKAMELAKGLVPDSSWRCTAFALEFARMSERGHSSAYIPLLEELDHVLNVVVGQIGHIYPGHWSRYYQAGDERPFEWVDNTLVLAVEYGLSAFLDYKFRQIGDNPCYKEGRPLLDYAVSRDIRSQRYGLDPGIIATLLEHGADPGQRYKSTTPWENALNYAYRLQFKELKTHRRRNGVIEADRDQVQEIVDRFRDFIADSTGTSQLHLKSIPPTSFHQKAMQKHYQATTGISNSSIFSDGKMKPDDEKVLKSKPDRDTVLKLISLFQTFIDHGADPNESCLVQIGSEDHMELRPVLYIVNDVFWRWYPEESAKLVEKLEQLEQCATNEELVSGFEAYRITAWNRMSQIKLRFWA